MYRPTDYFKKDHFIEIAIDHFWKLLNCAWYISKGSISLDRQSKNCAIVKYQGIRAIIYINTIVAYEDTNGDYILNTDGWETVTTKKWINKFLPSEIVVYQEDFRRFIALREWGVFTRQYAEFIDWMRITIDWEVEYY